MLVSIDVTKEEYELVNSYAKFYGVSITDAFKRALFEKIEDEIDEVEAEYAYQEYLKDPKTITHEQLMREVFDEI